MARAVNVGKVYLVGAGPGDPDLLTLKGLRLLKSAGVVVYDRLIDPALLKMAREGARLHDVGKTPLGAGASQARISALLVDEARRGGMVVRLKGGDPFVFGRGGEEAETLHENGIPFEVVPGVTSAIAAPAYAGIPLTHRDFSSSFTVFTGSLAGGEMDWDALAHAPGTLVALMGWRKLDEIAEGLMRHGKPGDTPAAVISWGSEPWQRTACARLDSIAEAARGEGLSAPATLVIGEVARLRDRLSWFETLPLFGRRVLVTRAREQAGGLAARLSELGGLPVEAATIETVELEDYSKLDGALADVCRFDWIAFTSSNAARAVMGRLRALGKDARALSGARVAAMGGATAAELETRGIVADFIPARSSSAGLAEGLAEVGGAKGRVLLPRSDIATCELPQKLRASGADVVEVAAYRTVTPNGARDALIEALDAGVDALTLTSASAAINMVALLDGDVRRLDGVAVACIGGATAAAAGRLGLSVDIVARTPSMDALARDLATYLSESG